MAARLHSPTSPFFLGSNDDNRERAQARAAPAAAIRRKSVAFNLLPQQGDPNHGLGKAQILELFQNCIKLASENAQKINQKNTWELNLIDHLTDIINVEEEKDAETNFQKACCTLEAGVKIYSMRVDSVHSEAYKVLGGMNRVGQESEQVKVLQTLDHIICRTNGNEHAKSKMKFHSLVDRFDEDNKRPPDIYTCDQDSAEQVDAAYYNEADFDCDVSENCGNWDYDHDDQTSNNEPGAYHELDMGERHEKVDGFLFLSLGFASKQNAWVGPDHWKHRKIKVSKNDRPAEEPVTVKQKKTKAQQDLDFTKSLEAEFSDIFAPPKNPKSLLLPASGAPRNTKLPEDCHY
ncbi:hypothetical protein DVH24_028146 [Malus domestica]|uniref:Condensin complex subunit 2 n=1 Tax=Malus domestica TaxID=3750 RepID=A0A498HAG7_MALDO|nr:hypothetical protein DVH24_028146 [Malus domestica]